MSPMDKSYKQKLNIGIIELIDMMIQIDLTDIPRTFNPDTKEYIFVSASHRTFSKIGHSPSQIKSKQIEKKLK